MEKTKFDLSGKKVWVAGHRGMAGSAIVRRLAGENCTLITATRAELDLQKQADVESWLKKEKPDAVFLAAAKVGGIWANDTYPADFLYENLAIQTNVIHGSYLAGVKKLLFLGSSCIYPRLAEQPMKEEALLTGPLEATNQWYAIAKITGIMMCQAYRRQYGCDYISAMPTNLFGPGDNYDAKGSHVVAALIQKAHKAKKEKAQVMELWGTGKPLREFLYVDDLADALVFLMKNYSDEPHINVGSGVEHTIRQLAEAITGVVGFDGGFAFDATKPDGTPRKLMDSGRLRGLGWRPQTSLESGLKTAYEWYLQNKTAA
jgi:GDP-L-fucose synthase